MTRRSPRQKEERLVKLFDILCIAAEAGLPCPQNAELAGLLGYSSISGPVALMATLIERRLITVERYSASRRVTIAITGKKTFCETGGRERGSGPRPPAKPAIYRPIETAGIPNRDPCVKCAVRPDWKSPSTGEVGCKHSRAAGIAL